MIKRKKTCPQCGAKYSGKRCRSQICTQLRALPTGRVKDWKLWCSVSLLVGVLGSAVILQAEKDGDDRAKPIGERLCKWSVRALEQGKRFGVPIQYAMTEDRRFDKCVNSVWPSNMPLHVFHAGETLQMLVADILDRFKDEYSPESMAPWNWMQAALIALQKGYDEDILDFIDDIERDYEKFHALFWGERKDHPKILKMYDVGGRFAVAATSKKEAKEVVKMNSGIVGLKSRWMDANTIMEYEGKTVRCSEILKGMKSPGLVAFVQNN